MVLKKRRVNVDFDWAQIVQRAMNMTVKAYMDEVKKHKPSNPRSPTYPEDMAKYQQILTLPKAAQALSIDDIRTKLDKPRNSSNSQELKKVKEELAKINESKAKVEKDFAELEKKYKALDAKVKNRK